MSAIYNITLICLIFYILFSTYILYLESQKKNLIKKILFLGIIAVILSSITEIFPELKTSTSLNQFPSVVLVFLLTLIAIFTIHLTSKNKKSTSETNNPKDSKIKKNPNVVANWTEPVLNIMEDRRDRKDRRGLDRRREGSFVKLENEESKISSSNAPILEVAWHGVFSENIADLLNRNIFISKNIHSDFYIFILSLSSKEILEFKIPKVIFKFLPLGGLDFSGVQFSAGDKILICSKNLFSTPNKEGNSYEKENIKNFLIQNHALNSKDFSYRFADELIDWFDGLKQEGNASFCAIEII